MGGAGEGSGFQRKVRGPLLDVLGLKDPLEIGARMNDSRRSDITSCQPIKMAEDQPGENAGEGPCGWGVF